MTTQMTPRAAERLGPRAVGRAATAADWVAASGHGRIHTLAPPTLVRRPPLTGVDSAPSVRKVQRFVAPAAQAVELPHAHVWGPDGTVITADGCVVEDLTRAWGNAVEDHPAWTAPPTPLHEVPGTAAVVAARGAATNFSHFLAGTLPRVQLVRDAGIDIDSWIVSSLNHSWQRDGLRLAGIPADQIITLTDIPLVRAHTLVVPSPSGFAPTTAPWARDRLTRLLQPESRPRHRRILISRNRARRRRLLNEDELLDVLTPHGFERVDFDTMSLADQIKTIHRSQAIVAVHGAALGHILHTPPTGHLVEITNPRSIHPDYWGLAALGDWNHTIVCATPASTCTDGVDGINQDLTVDAAAVRAAVARPG